MNEARGLSFVFSCSSSLVHSPGNAKTAHFVYFRGEECSKSKQSGFDWSARSGLACHLAWLTGSLAPWYRPYFGVSTPERCSDTLVNNFSETFADPWVACAAESTRRLGFTPTQGVCLRKVGTLAVSFWREL